MECQCFPVLCNLWELFTLLLPVSGSLSDLVEFYPTHAQIIIQPKTHNPMLISGAFTPSSSLIYLQIPDVFNFPNSSLVLNSVRFLCSACGGSPCSVVQKMSPSAKLIGFSTFRDQSYAVCCFVSENIL